MEGRGGFTECSCVFEMVEDELGRSSILSLSAYSLHGMNPYVYFYFPFCCLLSRYDFVFVFVLFVVKD